jgi:hypothetical protein
MRSGRRSPIVGRSARALLWALVAVLACDGYDEDATLVVAIRVEPAVQVTTEFPAQVLVGFDSSGSGFVVFRVGFLCGPPSAPVVITTRFPESAAGGPSAIDAWVVPVDRGMVPTCGALPAPPPVASSPPRAVGARTRGNVVVLAGCGSGDVRSATLVIGG